MKKLISAILVAALCVSAFAACAPAAAPETPEASAPAEAHAAPVDDVDQEPAEAATEEPGAEVDEAINAAIANIEASTGKQTVWNGPTEGPAAVAGKKIVVVNANSANPSEAAWGNGVKTACDRIGWECTILDGKGTTQGQLEAFSQAIAVGADAIVTSADVEFLQASIEEAKAAGIPTVGIHGTAINGPVEELNLLYNVTTTGTQIGHALADYTIAKSNGTGRVIILYDSQYGIARMKAEAMQERIEEVPTMQLLDVVNSPLSEISTNMPSLAASWVSTYGTDEPIYVISIADCYYDYITASLRSAGVTPEQIILVGSDGDPAAYDRIRADEYQAGTIPESAVLMGFIAVDQINRHFNGEEPYVFDMSVFIVTADNINDEGGENNEFIPSNGFQDVYAGIWGVE